MVGMTVVECVLFLPVPLYSPVAPLTYSNQFRAFAITEIL